ncbi:MAG: hypothetical protein M1814_001352 [Vezdaea aestivalis]|nr:MAG: hypothetical protein M1814_001352 [Vezdaea aestivalis]
MPVPLVPTNSAVKSPPVPTVEDGDPDRPGSENEGTVVGDSNNLNHHHLQVDVADTHRDLSLSLASPSQTREQQCRLDDDLEMLRAEQVVSNAETSADVERLNSRSVHRSRSRRSDPVDDFEAATNPLHEKAAVYRPPENPSTNFAKFLKRIHESSFLVRYFTYIVPLVCVILIPLLLGALLFKNASIGGVRLMWFCIWLQIVWCSLWAGRILAKAIPWPVGLVASAFTNNSKKWRDLAKQLEVPATLFFWWLAVEISFLPTMKNHHVNGNKTTKQWETTMNKIIITVFVGFCLNFFEKIIIQLIAISFHLRTYADRIDINKFQIGSLVKLYTFSKDKIQMDDSDFEQPETRPASGANTPMVYVKKTQKTAREAMTKVTDVAGKVAGDFTGKAVVQSDHPHQIVLTLLSTNSGAAVLARRLYRTFARDETETVFQEDLKDAFDNDEEADSAFAMFDKDLNGDISMEELEAVCVEIGRERKSITASLKDLDSVVSRLDDILVFVVVVITLLVFLTLISTSAAGVLTSAGSAVLALSWLFAATAQEFLQSIIFVFAKHPIDVGDRVSIYGNTGSLGKGDDYFVKKISLLYTEFKKMEGQIVQAPNSVLNTLFILNMRRSGGLAEAVPVVIKFGTTLEQIESLRLRLLEFVTDEKREYQGKILTELREVTEAHSITLNIVFFYKSNWQNELLRLQRRNKFICALMVSMQALGIEGPRMRLPGQKEDVPFYLQNASALTAPAPSSDNDSNRPDPTLRSQPSILRSGGLRARGESAATMSKRVDFSLGMKDISSGDMFGDVHSDRATPKIPRSTSATRQPRSSNDSGVLARTTSRDTTTTTGPGLTRVSTDSQARLRSSASTHRNRFFRRGRDSEDNDVETGNAGFMAGIPESGQNSAGARRPLDSRTGLVSPQAIETQPGPLEATPTLQEVASFGNGIVERQDPRRTGPSAQSEAFELRRLR